MPLPCEERWHVLPHARTYLRERRSEAALHGRNGLRGLLRLCGRVVLAKDRCQCLRQEAGETQRGQGG